MGRPSAKIDMTERCQYCGRPIEKRASVNEHEAMHVRVSKLVRGDCIKWRSGAWKTDVGTVISSDMYRGTVWVETSSGDQTLVSMEKLL